MRIFCIPGSAGRRAGGVCTCVCTWVYIYLGKGGRLCGWEGGRWMWRSAGFRSWIRRERGAWWREGAWCDWRLDEGGRGEENVDVRIQRERGWRAWLILRYVRSTLYGPLSKQMLEREQEVQMATERRRTEAGRRRQNPFIPLHTNSIRTYYGAVRKSGKSTPQSHTLKSLYGSSTEQLNSDCGE